MLFLYLFSLSEEQQCHLCGLALLHGVYTTVMCNAIFQSIHHKHLQDQP